MLPAPLSGTYQISDIHWMLEEHAVHVDGDHVCVAGEVLSTVHGSAILKGRCTRDTRKQVGETCALTQIVLARTYHPQQNVATEYLVRMIAMTWQKLR